MKYYKIYIDILRNVPFCLKIIDISLFAVCYTLSTIQQLVSLACSSIKTGLALSKSQNICLPEPLKLSNDHVIFYLLNLCKNIRVKWTSCGF